MVGKLDTTKLMEEHLEMGEYMARALLKKWRMSLEADQLLSVVGMALAEAGNRFDDTLGASFSTYFHYYLRGSLIRELTRGIEDEANLVEYEESAVAEIPDPGEMSLSGRVDESNPEELFERRELHRRCDDACEKLDELEKEVLVRHFVCEESISRIAEELGYSRCHISRVKTGALSQLEEPLGDFKECFNLKTDEKEAVKLPEVTRRRRRYELRQAA